MEIIDHKAPAIVAQMYLGTTAPLTRLGWGITGHVYLSPDLASAVKVHRRDESFWNEVQVYHQLRRLRLDRIHGLTIPKLRAYRADLRIIHMDFVTAPYLLDFAGASLEQPDFSEETMQDWHNGIQTMFGPNAPIVYAVQRKLAQQGIHYMDFRPSNMNLTGLAEAQPYPVEDSDDF